MSDLQLAVAYYGVVTSLCVKSFQEGSEPNTNKYLLVLSRLVNCCMNSPSEELRLKCVALLASNFTALQLIIDYHKQLHKVNRSMLVVLKYILYTRKDKLSEAMLIDATKVMMDGCIHEDKSVRKESNRCVQTLLENGYNKLRLFMTALDSSIKFNLDNWFIKPQRALYTLYLLTSTLKHFGEQSIKANVEVAVRIIEGQSTQELKTISYLTVENVFANTHINGAYTKDLLFKLLDICEKNMLEMHNDKQIASMIQCIVQVFLNYNATMPSLSKELLSRVVDLCGEVLCVDPADITSIDAATIRSIKERVTKNIELLLSLSIDDYLFPSDDALDIFGLLSVEVSEPVPGAAVASSLTPRRKLLITLKNMLTNRYETSRLYVMNIIDAFVSKLHDLGFLGSEKVTLDVLELLVDIKENLGLNELTEKCLGNMISKVNMDTLLTHLPIDVLTHEVNSEDFDAKSNAWLLSLLAVYKTRGRFNVYYKHLWTALHKVVEKRKLQEHFKDSQRIDTLLFDRLKNIELQYLSILRKSTAFNDECTELVPTFINSLLDVLLALDENQTDRLSYYCEPLKYLLVFAYNIRSSSPTVFSKSLQTIKDNQLMMRMCKLNNKLDGNLPYINDIIRLLIIMIDKSTAASIISKNVQRLHTYYSSAADLDVHSKVFERNLRDLDTIHTMLDAMRDLHTLDLYHEACSFIDALYSSDDERVWKKATAICVGVIKNSHYTYCPQVFAKVSSFYQERMKQLKAARKDRSSDMQVEEKVKTKKVKQRLQSTILKVANQFIESYFKPLLEIDPSSSRVAEEVSTFADTYIPIAVVSLKNKSAKTRDVTKSFMVSLDELYGKISNDDKSLISMTLAGLAGRTSLMKSATIQMIGHLVENRSADLDDDFKVKLLEVIVLLLKEKNRETFNAVIGFIRTIVKIIPQASLLAILPTLIEAIYQFDSESATSSPKQMTLLLERIVKKVGEEAVDKCLPEEQKSVLRYIRKQEKRTNKTKQRRKARELEARLKPRSNPDRINIRETAEDTKDRKQPPTDAMKEEEINKPKDLLLAFDSNVRCIHPRNKPSTSPSTTSSRCRPESKQRLKKNPSLEETSTSTTAANSSSKRRRRLKAS